MKVAFALVSNVISTAHVVVLGQSVGSVRGRTMGDHGAYFLYASQAPPPACVRYVGMRASGSVPGGLGAFAGWYCMRYPLFRRTCVRAPLWVWSGVSVKKRMSGEWSSSMLSMPVREGLFAPAFWALMVKNVRLVVVGKTSAGGCSGPVLTWSSCGTVVSLHVRTPVGEACIRYAPGRVCCQGSAGR